MRKPAPHAPPRKPRENEAKAVRLAEALRANLVRRKAQARARAAESAPPSDAG
jgi:hypothetical protein